jgi:gliding motility-associated-like protein
VVLEVLNQDSILTYEWFNTEGNQSVGTGSSLKFTGINLEEEGTYYVVASSQICSSDASQIITLEIESIEESSAYAGQDTIVCQPDFLLGQDTTQKLSGSWSILGSNITSSILNPEEYTSLIVDLDEGETKLAWTVDAAICFEHTVDTISITYLPPPLLIDDSYELAMNAESMNNIILNDQLATSELFISLLSQAKMGTFELLEDGQTIYIPNENFIGMDTIQYSVCYEFCPTDCDEATVIFRVGEESECFIPSIFTPNGDGINDYFAIPFLRKYEQSKIYIYNRWGDEVYFSDNYQGEWDGTYKGGSMPSGTYYYILEINDQDRNVKIGYIFIQR